MCAILGGNEIDWDYESGIQSMKHRRSMNFFRFLIQKLF